MPHAALCFQLLTGRKFLFHYASDVSKAWGEVRGIIILWMHTVRGHSLSVETFQMINSISGGSVFFFLSLFARNCKKNLHS